jgi:hypothetical protein
MRCSATGKKPIAEIEKPETDWRLAPFSPDGGVRNYIGPAGPTRISQAGISRVPSCRPWAATHFLRQIINND